MDMSSQMKIEGQDARIEIAVRSYENTDAQLLSDANWLTCVVSLAIGPVTAAFDGNFTTQDFSRLRDQLAKGLAALKGTALFETDEGALRFLVEFDNRGTARVTGAAKIDEQTRVAVEFSFDTDQTFLRRTLTELDALCGAFPVKDRL